MRLFDICCKEALKNWQKHQIEESEVVNVFPRVLVRLSQVPALDTLLDIERSIQIETGPSGRSTNNITNWCLNWDMEDIYIQKNT